MMGWLKSPGGSTATAVAVAAILALFWFAPWSKPLPFMPTAGAGDADKPLAAMAPPTPQPASSAAVADVRPKADTAPPTPSPAPAQTAAPALTQTAALAPESPKPPSPASVETPPSAVMVAPDFDVVRVEPSGAAVIAGRGQPGTEVALLDGGKVIANVQVDKSGQFALLPPDLVEGSHYLTLQSKQAGQAPVISPRGVAIAVAKNGKTRPMVAMLSPDKPVEVLSDGSASAPGASGPGAPSASAAPNATPLPVSIQAVEASLGGKFTASGVAKAGSQCRLYLNGSFLADVTTGKDGHWSVRVEKGMRAGRYTVRADELEPVSGKVVNRAEVPFDYPANFAAGRAKQLLMSHATPTAARKPAPAPAPTMPAAVVADNKTTSASVVRTDAGPAPAPALAASSPKPVAPAPTVVARLGQPAIPAAGTGTDAAIVADLQTAKVIRGDSLWRISRKMLGRGVDYTEIYASNNNQIRDPALIYPGQILVVPARPTN